MATDAHRYETYEGFLTAVIRDYWESRKRNRVGFLALLFASREAWSVAWEQAATPASSKKILGGAAGVAVVGLLLRTVLGGPIGLVLGGASIASLVGVYAKHHERIWAQVENTRKLVESYEGKWRAAQTSAADGKLDREQFELVVDGLEARLLRELEAGAPEDADDVA